MVKCFNTIIRDASGGYSAGHRVGFHTQSQKVESLCTTQLVALNEKHAEWLSAKIQRKNGFCFLDRTERYRSNADHIDTVRITK